VPQDTTREIFENKSLKNLEERGSIVPVSEVFRLQVSECVCVFVIPL
jgi:hypothetical protein